MKNISRPLDWILYIHFLFYFQKDIVGVKFLINSSSEVNALTLGYALKLGLKAQQTNVRALKINGSTFVTFGIVLTSFQVEDKLGKAKFF